MNGWHEMKGRTVINALLTLPSGALATLKKCAREGEGGERGEGRGRKQER